MVKTIKISDENYDWLTKLAGKLQHDHGIPMSIDRALLYLHKSKNVSELAGTWQIADKQVNKTKDNIKESWKTWGLRYLKQKVKK
jgi:predicted CopG family antitoxin